MASRVLPGLGLNGFWNQGETWKSGGDLNWLALSVLTQLVVESATAALPTSPANGVVHIAPTGDANAGKVAVRDAGAWVYFTAPVGTPAWVKDGAGADKRMWFDGTTWSNAFGAAALALKAPLASPVFTGDPEVPHLRFSNVAAGQANTLDFFEVGTFTPTLYGVTTAGAPMYQSQTGRFTRVNKLVIFSARVVLSNKGGMGGTIRMAGLPYAAAANGVGVFSAFASQLNLAANSPLAAVSVANTGNIGIQKQNITGSSGFLMDTEITDIFSIQVSGQYEVA